MANDSTWCFFTEFVCRNDQLEEAKKRHQKCVDKLRSKYKIHFSSEQAYNAGHQEWYFSLLLKEILISESERNAANLDDYNLFHFVTAIEIFDEKEDDFDTIVDTLEIDFEPGIPAKFPSRTRGILISKTGHEVDGCIYQ